MESKTGSTRETSENHQPFEDLNNDIEDGISQEAQQSIKPQRKDATKHTPSKSN